MRETEINEMLTDLSCDLLSKLFEKGHIEMLPDYLMRPIITTCAECGTDEGVIWKITGYERLPVRDRVFRVLYSGVCRSCGMYFNYYKIMEVA